MSKPFWFISAGIILTAFAIGNVFFDFWGSLMDRLQYNQIQTASYTMPVIDLVNEDPPLESKAPSAEITDISPQSSVVLDPKEIQPKKPTLEGFIPDRIEIPSIHLDAPIVISQEKSVKLQDQWFEQWLAPDEFAVGWQANSAPLGLAGNSILSGHHNMDGKVFGHLIEAKVGDSIFVYSGKTAFEYRVAEIMVLKERNVSLEIRKQNAAWISATSDERITLVTCWPKRSNTHRLIVVAYPASLDSQAPLQKDIQ